MEQFSVGNHMWCHGDHKEFIKSIATYQPHAITIDLLHAGLISNASSA